MKKYNIPLLKIVTASIIAAVLLIYGFRVGRYEVFPFDLLRSLVETKDERVLRSETFNHTALQRLYINKVPLPEDKANGGAMAALGTDVIIIDREGALMAIDFLNFEKLNVNVPPISMGLEMLKEQGWHQRDDFNPDKFRVKGAYAAGKGAGETDLYAFHHSYNGECFVAKLSRINLVKTDNELNALGDWQEIYRTSPCLYPDLDLLDTEWRSLKRWVFAGHISGGRIIRYDDDHLLVSVGDYFYDGYDKEIYAADEDKSYGKFILINIHSGEHRNYAMGSRNAQGLYKDNDGIIWSTEHGPQGGDELNIIKEGEHYGWPMESLGIQYNNTPWPISGNQGRHDRYTAPVFAWAGAVAPSDLVRIEGDKFALWQGDLIVATLNGRAIHRLRPDSDLSRIIYDERIEIGHRIRNIIELHDGSLLLRTDDKYLIHIEDAGPVYGEFNFNTFLMNNEIARRFQELNGGRQETMNMDEGALVFERSCSNCHAMGDRSLIGPSLKGLDHRRVGSVDDFNYSPVMVKSEAEWDEKLLKEYLQSPQSVFPGTSKGRINLSETEFELIAEYLLGI